MCDSGPSLVLRTRWAFCTQAPSVKSKACATSSVANNFSTDNTFTVVRNPMVTKFSNNPLKRACCSEVCECCFPFEARAITGRVPRPGSRLIKPSSANCCNARRTVTRATPNCPMRDISPGKPCANLPSCNCSRNTKYTWWYLGNGMLLVIDISCIRLNDLSIGHLRQRRQVNYKARIKFYLLIT